MAVAVLAGCVGVRHSASSSNAPGAAQTIPETRLPTNVRPLSYALDLRIVPSEERFAGRARIEVQLVEQTQTVWLHGRSLNVTGVRALLAPGKGTAQVAIPGSYHQVNAAGVVALHFEQPLPAGRATLDLSYDAAFDRDLKGLYRVDAGGASYAFTQFEPTFARQAFPCFDEPSFKVRFDVTLTVPADLVAAGNAPIVSEQPAADGVKLLRFATTAPLPTYLVAFAVGPFDVVQGPEIPPTGLRPASLPLRGLAVRGKGALLATALAETARTLPAFENYFGGPYPYAKLDLVAVPDFGGGAMENAGLITFRDYLLLIDPQHPSEHQLRSSASVIAHELAHNWVGNLVTMRYWDDIWLNEGFATWIGQRTVAELHREHKADLATLSAVFGAMDADSRASARVVRQPIASAHDIANAFDSITYNKGAAVLAMFERYLGLTTFQRGVRDYLKAHAWGNASTEDFVNALSTAARQDMHAPFASFLTQPGVPLVTAEVACDGQRAELRLRQSRYTPLGFSGSSAGRWMLPICVRYDLMGIRESCMLLAADSGVLPLDGEGCPTWVMPNAGAAGYYRFAMPAADMAKLRTHAGQLLVRERFALTEAFLSAFESGALPGADVIDALAALSRDSEREIATAAMGLLGRVHDELVETSQQSAVQAYARTLYQPLARRLGVREGSADTGDDKLLRSEVHAFLVDVGRDGAMRKQLARLGKQYLGLGTDEALHPEVLASDLTDVAVRVLVEDSDARTWDAALARLKAADQPLLRGRLLRALSSVRDERSTQALALSLDPALRVSEVLVPLRGQLRDPRTRSAAWRWLETNFDALAQRISLSNAGGTPWLGAVFCDDAMAARVQAFFEPRVAAMNGGPRSLAGATEAIRLCAASAAAQRESVRAYIAKPLKRQ